MDLLARKVVASKGEVMGVFIDEVNAYINKTSADNMQEYIQPLSSAVKEMTKVTEYLLIKSADNADELGGAANDYLHLFGYTAMAYVWAKMVEVSLTKLDEDKAFHQSKIYTARYFFARLLPRTQSLIATIKSGSEVLFDNDDEYF